MASDQTPDPVQKSIFIFGPTETPKGVEELLADEAKTVGTEAAQVDEQKERLKATQDLSAAGNGGLQGAALDYAEPRGANTPPVQKSLDDLASEMIEKSGTGSHMEGGPGSLDEAASNLVLGKSEPAQAPLGQGWQASALMKAFSTQHVEGQNKGQPGEAPQAPQVPSTPPAPKKPPFVRPQASHVPQAKPPAAPPAKPLPLHSEPQHAPKPPMIQKPHDHPAQGARPPMMKSADDQASPKPQEVRHQKLPPEELSAKKEHELQDAAGVPEEAREDGKKSLEKSRYIRRTGTPGDYKYEYTKPGASSQDRSAALADFHGKRAEHHGQQAQLWREGEEHEQKWAGDSNYHEARAKFHAGQAAHHLDATKHAEEAIDKEKDKAKEAEATVDFEESAKAYERAAHIAESVGNTESVAHLKNLAKWARSYKEKISVRWPKAKEAEARGDFAEAAGQYDELRFAVHEHSPARGYFQGKMKEMMAKKSLTSGIDALGEYLEKSKYTKRTRMGDHWVYEYAKPSATAQTGEGHRPPQEAPEAGKQRTKAEWEKDKDRAEKQDPDSYAAEPHAAKKPEATGPKSGGEQFAPGYTQAAADYEKRTRKSMTDKENHMAGINELNEYLAKAQSLPTGGEAKLDHGHGDHNPNGADVNGLGGIDHGTGPLIRTGDTEPMGEPSVPEKKLSEDDDKVKEQLKPGEPKKPPMPEHAKKSLPEDMDRTGHSHREVAAHEAKLRKGEADVTVGVGVSAPKAQPEVLEKALVQNQGPDSLISYSNAADLAAERFAKGDFYSGGEPSLGFQKSVMTELATCGCGARLSKSLSVCPSCGRGAGGGDVVTFQKSEGEAAQPTRHGPSLRPARSGADLFLPNGTKTR